MSGDLTGLCLYIQVSEKLIPKSAENEIKTKKGDMLNCATWNVRRGLVLREIEIKEILVNEKIDIFFLTETDTKSINCETDYKILGFETIFHERKNPNDVLRIICLVKEELMSNLEIRFDLMDCEFPSIWIELKHEHQKSTIFVGFYREWTRNGDNSLF